MKYSHIIDDMTWSYSRVTAYEFCKYRWLMSYIMGIKGSKPMFFSSYGKFAHDLLADILLGNTKREDALIRYLTEFNTSVLGKSPSQKVFSNYFNDGARYFSSLKGLPESNIAGVEEEFEIEIDGVPLTGFIDLRTKENDKTSIWDHKSHALKQSSGKAKPTKSDLELREFQKQLYLYSEYERVASGCYPENLIFNCFRTGEIIREPFDKERMQETKDWFKRSVEEISKTDDWDPSINYFKCRYLCDINDECEYFQLGGRSS